MIIVIRYTNNSASYGGNFSRENGHLSLKNAYYWDDYH